MQEPKPSNFYMQKSWCDAKDGLGVWRVGRIKKRQKDLITIHFDGWSDKWKQIYCLHSDLIAPFRMHSKGYTGQSKLALREWDYSEDNLKVHEGKMKMMTHNEFSGFNPRDLTNFLRGDLFIQVDCLLSFTYTNPSKDIPRVCEFFGMVLELILKWLQLAPSKYETANLKEPDAYLYERPTAIYKAGYELLETLISILGLNPRTAKFYDKYKALTSAKPLIQTFMNKQGMTHIKAIIESKLPLEDFWNFLVVVPQLFSSSTTSANRYIPDYIETLINNIDNISDEGMMAITDDYAMLEKFIDNINNMAKLALQDNQRDLYIGVFRNKFRLDRQSFGMRRLSDSSSGGERENPLMMSQSVLEIRASELSPRSKPIDLSSLSKPLDPRIKGRQSTLQMVPKSPQLPARLPYNPAPSLPPPHPHNHPPNSISSSVIESLQSSIAGIKTLVETKHQECLNLIEKSLKTGMDKNLENEYKLEEVFKEHNSCDHQEFAILSSMEYLLSENKVNDALRLLRWRKKILKLANMNGWEVAEDVAKRTLQKLEVTANDIIDSNLRSMMSSRSSLDSR